MADTGELVLVTGGASGIGEACAAALAQDGFRALIVDLAPPPAQRRLAECLYWNAPYNVADEHVVARETEAIEARFGPICGCVHAAGILGRMSTAEKLRADVWRREIDVDLTGSFHVAQAVGQRMIARQRGAIVLIASIAGMTTSSAHAYSAAKAGVVSLTRTLASEWGRRGVRVNALSPGFTRTRGLESALASGVMEETRMAECTSMGRVVEAHEVGAAASFLISDKASAITGINLPVDAGFLAGVTWAPYGRARSNA